ncbi:unnamed protein product [Fusarium graminearum]|nr:unnamed protein product [Fusarium graminearum]
MAMEGLVTGALLKFHYMRGHPLTLKSTSYFVAIGKIFNVGQSAGNLYNIQGSSETIRFAEGDGYFGVDKKGYLTFKVTQSTTDCQVLFFIKKSLGFGSVSLQSKSSKTHQYRVRDKNNLIKIINIFNGFTDGEGCFTASAYLSKATNKHIVTVRYVISQKNDIEFSQYLAELINGYITYIKSYDGYNTVVNHTTMVTAGVYLLIRSSPLIEYSAVVLAICL